MIAIISTPPPSVLPLQQVLRLEYRSSRSTDLATGEQVPFCPFQKALISIKKLGSGYITISLPALWSEFGNGCNCIVLLCHSLGVMGGIVAAAMHGQDEKPPYPLGGVIACGMGDTQSSAAKAAPSVHAKIGPDHVMFPLDIKDQVMFRPGTYSPGVLAHSERLNAATPDVEIHEFPHLWLPTWRDEWASHVAAPVMFTLVENDPFFEATEEEVRICAASFRKSARVDGSLVKGAPHCVELSYWSQEWYARCFGFAMECSASVSVKLSLQPEP